MAFLQLQSKILRLRLFEVVTSFYFGARLIESYNPITAGLGWKLLLMQRKNVDTYMSTFREAFYPIDGIACK